eukprot:4875277-Pleurochrysis_carterae.AAC.3
MRLGRDWRWGKHLREAERAWDERLTTERACSSGAWGLYGSRDCWLTQRRGVHTDVLVKSLGSSCLAPSGRALCQRALVPRSDHLAVGSDHLAVGREGRAGAR